MKIFLCGEHDAEHSEEVSCSLNDSILDLKTNSGEMGVNYAQVVLTGPNGRLFNAQTVKEAGLADGDVLSWKVNSKRSANAVDEGSTKQRPRLAESKWERERNEQWAPDVPHEVSVATSWACLLDSKPLETGMIEPVPGEEIFFLNPVLTKQESARLVDAACGFGFGKTDFQKAYRGNLRLQTLDSSLAEALWHRIRKWVPPVVQQNEEVWEAVGLNERWRLAEYHPGDRFKGHCDSCFRRNESEMSMFTVNIYMNGGFEGGATRFYDGKNAKVYEVTPTAGACVVFRQPPGQQYYHDGEELHSGIKHLFRTDVMYRRQ